MPSAILPLDGSNPFRKDDYKETPVPFDETWEQYIARTIDYKPILARLFLDPDKAGDILFKVLHNGKEATLPLDTEKWPYYSWDSFKEHFGK